MRIWDHGTFDVHKFDERKVEVTFHGERLHGRYGLFPLGGARRQRGDDWMIHRMEPATGSGPRADAREPRADARPAKGGAPARRAATGRSRSSGMAYARSRM